MKAYAPHSRYENILVRAPNWIGDHILSYPFFHFLRRGFPRAKITVVCVPWVEAVQFRNLVDDVVVLPRLPGARGTAPGIWASFQSVEQGAALVKSKGPFDLGIALPNSFSAAWLLKRAGVVSRRGYSDDGRGLLLTERLPWRDDPVIHRAEAYMRLLPESALPRELEIREFWGVPSKPEDELDDPGVPGVIASFEPEKAWPDADPIEPPKDPYWILAPGAVAESRRWPVERFAELARRVIAETGWKCVVVGGVTEARLADRIIGEVGAEKAKDLTAQGSVTRLWKLLRGSRFSVTNDSGLAHVAALCSYPGGPSVYVVWGAGDPKRTEPLGPSQIRIILNPVDCWPCESNSCSLPSAQKVECLRGIAPDAVWEEIRVGVEHRKRR